MIIYESAVNLIIYLLFVKSDSFSEKDTSMVYGAKYKHNKHYTFWKLKLVMDTHIARGWVTKVRSKVTHKAAVYAKPIPGP